MDLWGMLGVSRQALAVAVVIGAAAAILIARLARRRNAGQDRVRVNLSGRDY